MGSRGGVHYAKARTNRRSKYLNALLFPRSQSTTSSWVLPSVRPSARTPSLPAPLSSPPLSIPPLSLVSPRASDRPCRHGIAAPCLRSRSPLSGADIRRPCSMTMTENWSTSQQDIDFASSPLQAPALLCEKQPTPLLYLSAQV